MHFLLFHYLHEPLYYSDGFNFCIKVMLHALVGMLSMVFEFLYANLDLQPKDLSTLFLSCINKHVLCIGVAILLKFWIGFYVFVVVYHMQTCTYKCIFLTFTINAMYVCSHGIMIYAFLSFVFFMMVGILWNDSCCTATLNYSCGH